MHDRLSSLDYKETKENVILLQEQSLLPLHSHFRLAKIKGKSFKEVVLFVLKKTNEGGMGNPMKRQYCVYFRMRKRTKYFKA